jgi:hypothetical protein
MRALMALAALVAVVSSQPVLARDRDRDRNDRQHERHRHERPDPHDDGQPYGAPEPLTLAGLGVGTVLLGVASWRHHGKRRG